ncbi:uncharacterized protein LOC27209307 [Drosophila simulans]|uniref:uncharacterized protein LOC27209307 n=1 Tax=Drosophila simulans TaxID=7240 RepID=UPI00078AE3DA|nr:uncharacterized protein LOC27209307 [Drosophila simulans]KMZ09454.1 uncharacterized protein Dsimw501_GD29464 [Drosophila simulans]
MGVLATAHMIHIVCVARWRRETADDHIPGLHRRQEIQFTGHDSNSGRSDVDDRTTTSVKYLESVGSIPQAQKYNRLFRYWWPLNVCNDIRQKLPLIIENSTRPSSSCGCQG